MPASAARARAVDEGRVAAGAVERHFDGDDFGVFDGGEDEAFDAGVEGFVGVMHEHVALADDGEHVGFGVGEGGGDVGFPDGGEQVGAVDGDGDGHEVGFAEGFGEFVDGVFADFEAFHEVLAHFGGHVVGDLDADGVGEAAARSSSWTTSRRSSGSSISGSTSALRVTRKCWCSTISMPGKRASRRASMRLSMGVKM